METKLMPLCWTGNRQSNCGRFWCYQVPGGSGWQLWDKWDRNASGACKVYCFRTLAGCHRLANRLQKKDVVTVK